MLSRAALPASLSPDIRSHFQDASRKRPSETNTPKIAPAVMPGITSFVGRNSAAYCASHKRTAPAAQYAERRLRPTDRPASCHPGRAKRDPGPRTQDSTRQPIRKTPSSQAAGRNPSTPQFSIPSKLTSPRSPSPVIAQRWSLSTRGAVKSGGAAKLHANEPTTSSRSRHALGRSAIGGRPSVVSGVASR